MVEQSYLERKLKSYGTQLNMSVLDGIETLQAITSFDRPVGGRELARFLELDTTRVNRLLRTLAFAGFVRKTADRKYTIGPAMHVLAAQSLFASRMVSHAVKPLEELRAYGMVVAMGVLWKDKVTYLYHALPELSSIEALGRLGYFPATASGVGLSLLSQVDDDEVVHLYENKTIPGFPEGIAALQDKLIEIREQGFVRVRTSYRTHLPEGAVTLAVNIGNPAHSAIALSGDIPEERTEELVAVLREKALDIENHIR
ncbi:IclR family transcriptional regulator [Marinimicrobium sp. ARAG 43.8]|uniref:IclR family transcriptional regulator n=1 Tax=Marinimicrobium sp. ARAG 43.8 TaxID=3418719 RepID=UPI003CF2C390